MPHITLLAYQNCAPSSIYGITDALSIANLWHKRLNLCEDGMKLPLFKWDVVSIDGKAVQGGGGVRIEPHCSIYDINLTDFILVPGFLPPLNFIGNIPKELKNWILARYKNNTMIGSICTGTFLLAEIGILNGKTVTTNFVFAKYFRKLYPLINLKVDRILTEDSGIICSGATTSFIDLFIYLIKKFGFEELASICGKVLLKEPRSSQSPYFIFDYQKDHSDLIVKKAQRYIETKFTESISVESLAKEFGISLRHFVRRFKKATGDSPLLYIQRVRIESAKQKLEKTMYSVQEITHQVGYEDSNSFRKLFKKNTGLLPMEYRNRFSCLLKR